MALLKRTLLRGSICPGVPLILTPKDKESWDPLGGTGLPHRPACPGAGYTGAGKVAPAFMRGAVCFLQIFRVYSLDQVIIIVNDSTPREVSRVVSGLGGFNHGDVLKVAIPRGCCRLFFRLLRLRPPGR